MLGAAQNQLQHIVDRALLHQQTLLHEHLAKVQIRVTQQCKDGAFVGEADAGLRLATIAKAIDLAWLLIDHAKAAFALLGADEIDADAAAVLAWVRSERRPEFTRRDAQKAMEGRFRTVERLAKALGRLESMEVLRGFVHRPTKGRASQRYQVNPVILSTN